MKTLRPHQVRSMDMLRESIRTGHRRPLLQLPTGAGKTLIAASIVSGALAKGNRVAFVVPKIILIDQTIEAFAAEGISALGIIQADHHMTDAAQPVQICSAQTLRTRGWPDVNVAIIDEAHLRQKATLDWIRDRPDILFIGLSATPWSAGLGKHYDDLLIGATMIELTDAGYLSPFKVYAPESPDLSEVRTVAGEYHQGQLAEVMDQPEVTGDIVSTWLALAKGLPTLFFGVNRGHAESVAREFNSAGVAAEFQDCFTSALDRKSIKKRFDSGEITVVCNCETLTTGTDWDVRCLILGRPTKSRQTFAQIIGRALRTAPGKDHAILIDHTSTHERLGFVTDLTQGYLSKGAVADKRQAAREKKVLLPKACTGKVEDRVCGFVKPAGLHKCPSCGYAPPLPNNVQVVDGQIVEFASRSKSKPSKDASMDEKIRWYRQFVSIGERLGYKSGWALNTFKQKFGEWPNDQQYRDALPADTIDLEAERYVKYLRIKYAKGMAKAGRHA